MNFQPFIDTSPAIQIHMIAALMALGVGAVIFSRRKGTKLHKGLGRLWVCLMAVVALSSFMIHEIKVWGDFSPIHLISIFTLISLPMAIYHARKGNIIAHQRTMKGTYVGGLLVAGALTFLPGRLNFQLFFGGGFGIGPTAGWIIGLLAACAVGIYMAWQNRARSSQS